MREDFISWEKKSHVPLMEETVLIEIKERKKLLVLSRFKNQDLNDSEVNLSELVRTSRKKKCYETNVLIDFSKSICSYLCKISAIFLLCHLKLVSLACSSMYKRKGSTKGQQMW